MGVTMRAGWRLTRCALVCALVVPASACGRELYDPDVGASGLDAGQLDAGALDAGALEGGLADAFPFPRVCDWSSPVFDPPERALAGADGQGAYALSLSADGLRLTFTVDGVVFTASRSSLDTRFGSPARLDEVFDPAYRVDGVVMRRDGLELVLGSAELGGAGLTDLFRRTRPSVADPWSAPEPLTALNTALHDWDYFLEADGLAIWLMRQTADATSQDILRATRLSLADPFGAAAVVPALSDPTRLESSPTLPDDGSVVVLMVDLDLHYAPVVGGAPQAPTPIPGVNSAALDYEPTVRADGCEILFVSNRFETLEVYRAVMR
jgi:hypothetical protein